MNIEQEEKIAMTLRHNLKEFVNQNHGKKIENVDLADFLDFLAWEIVDILNTNEN